MSHHLFEAATAIEDTPEELFDWHARPGAFERLVPPWVRVDRFERAPLVEGSRVRFRIFKGPIPLAWTAEHRNVKPGRSFEDVQVRGPFARWEHTHLFEPRGEGSSILRDRLVYELPGEPLTSPAAALAVRPDLEATFRYRHRTTREDLALHRRYHGRPRLTVAVTGASGLLGSTLVPLLETGGHRVVRLVRDADPPAEGCARWSPEHGLVDAKPMAGVDAVVHLAGEPIAAGRWTAERKRRIRESRVAGTSRLVASLLDLPHPPATLVSASAVGFYGDRGDERLDELSPRGDGFLAEVGEAWEAAALQAADRGVRVVATRFGILLSPRGGALGRMLPPFRLGLGGPLGGGRQFQPWVTVDDAAAAVLHALMTPELSGPVNVTSPVPVRQRELARSLGRVLRRPALAPMPATAVRLLFGEMADEVLLASSRAEPLRLQESGFHFRDPELEPALASLLGRR